MSALEAAVADDVLTAQEMVALLQDVLVARLDPADLPASAPLQSAILAEIDALIAANHVTFAEAVATMASSASGLSGAMLFAIGGEIVAFVGGHAGSEAASVAAILAASTRCHHRSRGAGPAGRRRHLGRGGRCRWRRAAALPGSSPPAASRRTAPRSASTTPSSAAASLSVDLVAVTAGLWANGGIGVGAEVLYQVGSHGLATYADLAGQLATAVGAGTLSAGEMIDGAVAVVLLVGQHRSRRGLRVGADLARRDGGRRCRRRACRVDLAVRPQREPGRRRDCPSRRRSSGRGASAWRRGGRDRRRRTPGLVRGDRRPLRICSPTALRDSTSPTSPPCWSAPPRWRRSPHRRERG